MAGEQSQLVKLSWCWFHSSTSSYSASSELLPCQGVTFMEEPWEEKLPHLSRLHACLHPSVAHIPGWCKLLLCRCTRLRTSCCPLGCSLWSRQRSSGNQTQIIPTPAWRPRAGQHSRGSVSHLERVLETVGRTLLVSLGGFFPFLAEQKHFVIEEQMPLHGFEPGQVLHLKPEQQWCN